MTGKSLKFADLKPDLIDPQGDQYRVPLTFAATLRAHGSYETTRFVLRLSPRNHELMEQIEAEAFGEAPIPWDAVQAYSTYIHETVHWWQHVGSTSGLLLSLSYFSQCHSSLEELRDVLATFGPKKSLKDWTDNILLAEGWSAQGKLASANIAVNNALDVFYYKSYAFQPRQSIQWMIKQKHFEDIGYSYGIVYGLLMGLVSGSIDPDFEFLPDVNRWDAEMLRLHTEQHQGFCKGSNVILPPLGLHAIYEGQARFIQLDFLNRSRSEPLTCAEWRGEGYLSGIYVEAFESFLKLTETEWPDSLFDPIVPLFLLVCDLSINPTRGMPLDIENFEHFIDDVDVGIRFARMCFTVKSKPYLKSAITELSKDEYIKVSEELTEPCGYDHPLAALSIVKEWVDRYPRVAALMEEHRTFDFGLENLPVRVFLSHYIAMCIDKLENPQFFCWPGAYMAGHVGDFDAKTIWLRHLSLFSDRAEKDGVYPRKWPSRSEVLVKSSFERFYGSMALYELTQQWILDSGPFDCDFSWMSDNYDQKLFRKWANESFKAAYGVNLSDFEFVAPPN